MTATPPKKRTDRRLTLTVKGDQFTPEFRALVNKAAKRKGMTQAEFVADVLDREARKVLTGGTTPEDPKDTPPPPALVERIEDTDKQVKELAEQVRKLTELQQRTLWQKLREAFVAAPRG